MKEAIEQTRQVIERLARHHRNLVVAVVAVAFLSVAGAAWGQSFRPLVLLGALIPLCGFKILLDTISVHRWCDRLLAAWVADRLDPDVFVAAMQSLRTLPPKTMQGLLDMLPSKEKLGQPSASLPVASRQRIQAVSQASNGLMTKEIVATIVCHTITLGVIGWVVLADNAHRFLMLGILPLAWVAAYLLGKYRRKSHRKKGSG